MKTIEIRRKAFALIGAAAALAIGTAAAPLAAQSETPAVMTGPTYADLADLAIPAKLVIKAKIRKQATLKPERAPSLRPGWARLYIEAQTLSLISGDVPIGESLKYLVDVRLDADGDVPKLKNREVLLFALPVPGRPAELQLVDVDAQLPADPQTEARTTAILRELASPDAPPRIEGVRDVLSVGGNLAGESETQLFLDAAGGATVAISVVRRPGMEPKWGVSWTEIVDQSAEPPARDTLEWYRLACFLPDALPQEAFLSNDRESRVRAEEDYRVVIEQLGSCPRTRGAS